MYLVGYLDVSLIYLLVFGKCDVVCMLQVTSTDGWDAYMLDCVETASDSRLCGLF